jgi:hypothetical protein
LERRYGSRHWRRNEINSIKQSTAPHKIKITKAFRRISNEAICTLTGITPIVIKVEEVARLYITRKSPVHEIDHDVQPKDWLHPTDSESLNNKMITLYKLSQTTA